MKRVILNTVKWLGITLVGLIGMMFILVEVIGEPTPWNDDYVYSVGSDGTYAWLKIPESVITVGDLLYWSEDNGASLEEVRAIDIAILDNTELNQRDALIHYNRTGDLGAIIDHGAQSILLTLSNSTSMTVYVLSE